MPTEKTSRSGGDDLSPFVGVTVVLQADKAEEENTVTLKKNQSFVQKSFSKNEENLSSHDGQGDKISGSRPENSNPIHNSVPNDPSSDLCNFKATRLAHPINLFIRYSYPFFGTTSSMVTHPDVEVNPNEKSVFLMVIVPSILQQHLHY
ncbi:centrosomal protein [Trichonephila clavata]|uniref:Centrosomal protein n=1 Tax=Trichonephila clavata TaxID=2740835 RepID=A0A8X6GZZ9_TRICU|nr:centrosomal protein [Trichonephila clavata]